MADKWSDAGTFNPMIDCAYIRNGGDNGVAENFKVTITATPSTGIKTSTSITNTVTTSTSISNQGLGKDTTAPIYTNNTIKFSNNEGQTSSKPIYTDLSKFGTKNDDPIYIGVGDKGHGTAVGKPIYTYLSNIGTENTKPIYIRTSMPITEFTANIALQIYSWSNSMTTDGKQSIGNARRAAQDAFVRAEEFVKQLVREKYIVDIDKTNGLVVWRNDINKIM